MQILRKDILQAHKDPQGRIETVRQPVATGHRPLFTEVRYLGRGFCPYKRMEQENRAEDHPDIAHEDGDAAGT